MFSAQLFPSHFGAPFPRPFGSPGGANVAAMFSDVTGLGLSVLTLSNKIQLPAGGVLGITGGTFSINGAAYGTTGTAAAGDIIRLQATSSDQAATAVDVVLSVDAVVYDTWTLTTQAEDVIYHRPDTYNRSDVYDRDALIID